MGIGIRLVAMSRTRGRAVFFDANENDATVSIRKAHHRVHQLLVGNWRARVRDELGCELFAAREELAKLGVRYHDD